MKKIQGYLGKDAHVLKDTKTFSHQMWNSRENIVLFIIFFYNKNFSQTKNLIFLTNKYLK
jgi:hypothetical protein